jgi:hypothetical protein
MIDVESLPLHIDGQGRDGVLLGAIRRRDGACQDQPAIDVSGDVTLEAIEPLALTLAAVTHLLVLDRDASIFGHALANARTPADWIGLQILPSDLHEGIDTLLERGLGDFLGQAALDPQLQGVELTRERLDRLGLLDRIVPIDVERPLN